MDALCQLSVARVGQFIFIANDVLVKVSLPNRRSSKTSKLIDASCHLRLVARHNLAGGWPPRDLVFARLEEASLPLTLDFHHTVQMVWHDDPSIGLRQWRVRRNSFPNTLINASKVAETHLPVRDPTKDACLVVRANG